MHRLIVFSLIALAGVLCPISSGTFAQTLPPAVLQKIPSRAATRHNDRDGRLSEGGGQSRRGNHHRCARAHEFAAGHVPGAVNIPRGVLGFRSGNMSGPAAPQMAKPLYLQCQSGNRASLAAQSLAELGFTKTTAVVMSLDEWQQSGQPFIK